ncbi:MAG: hypothetical protein GY772_28865 [bacterium]|nr:hypothetical protein [bacterium]
MAALTKRSTSPAMARMYAELAKTKGRLRATRARTKGSGGAIEPVIFVSLGSAGAGFLIARYPTIGPVDSRLVVGGGLVVLGLFLLKKPVWKQRAILAGAGVLSPFVSDVVEGMSAPKGEEEAPVEEEAAAA